MSSLHLGLVHHPALNKSGEVVTSSVTNMDVHDISRSCRTFGVASYSIITPLKAQQALIRRILDHWEEDRAGYYNPSRQRALSLVVLEDAIEDAMARITLEEGRRPLVAVTGARLREREEGLMERWKIDKTPLLLLFGTGYGLPHSVTEKADFRLRPLVGAAGDGYNHLSVRGAVAIYLDRLQGR